MSAGDPGDDWDRVAEEVSHTTASSSDEWANALVGPIQRYVDRFLEEIWARHDASMRRFMSLDQLMAVNMACNMRYETGRGEAGRFQTSFFGFTFYIQLNGAWGFYIDSGDDYIPEGCIFGYSESGQFADGTSGLLTPLRRIPPKQILDAVLRELVSCAQADW